MPTNYTQLLTEEGLISFLNGIAESEKNQTIKTAAKNLSFVLSGNKVIPNFPYYNELYKKYNFKLVNVNSTDGLKVSVYSLIGQNINFIGQVQNKIIGTPVIVNQNSPVPILNSITSPTYNRRPNISGTSIYQSLITVYADDVEIGTTLVSSNNTFTFTPPSDFSFDTHIITATATIYSQTSVLSDPITFEVQELPSPTVNVTSPTYDRTPTITGTALASFSVIIYDGGNSIGTTTADGSGNWTFTPSSNLTITTHTITAATTTSGQTSNQSSPATLVIQQVPTPTVSVTSPTYDRTPTITGTALATSTVTVYDSGSSIGTTTADGSGDWTFTPGSNLTVATHQITATATISGQESNTSLPVTLVIQGVTTPTVSVTSPTYDRTPTITGTALATSTVTVYDGGSSIGTTTADGSGDWTFTPGVDLTITTHTITATSTIDGVTSDTSSPSTLIIQQVTAPTVSVTSPTYDRTPTITGTALATSTVTVYDGISSIGTTTADGSGNWTFTPNSDLSITTHTITATATISGQTSSASSPATLIIQQVTAPTVSVTSPTYDRTPTITGTAITTSTVTVYDGISSIGTTTADGSGNWTFTPSSNLTIATHTITATATISGQTSSASSPQTLVIQEVTTPTVSFTTPTTDRTPTITGTAIATSTITVYDSGSSIGTATADGSGNWTFTPGSDLSIGSHTITATATISGQTSSASSPQTLDIELPDLLSTIISTIDSIITGL
jgi:hypothetical protein